MQKYIHVVITTVLLLSGGLVQAAPKSFGLGLILFGPTGFSFNYQTAPDHTVDGALAWAFGEVFYVHGDYLWKTRPLLQDRGAVMQAHYGVGMRLRSHNETYKYKHHHDRGDRLGIRLPIGLGVRFANPSLEFFGELAAIMDLISETDLSLQAGIGGRYYF